MRKLSFDHISQPLHTSSPFLLLALLLYIFGPDFVLLPLPFLDHRLSTQRAPIGLRRITNQYKVVINNDRVFPLQSLGWCVCCGLRPLACSCALQVAIRREHVQEEVGYGCRNDFNDDFGDVVAVQERDVRVRDLCSGVLTLGSVCEHVFVTRGTRCGSIW